MQVKQCVMCVPVTAEEGAVESNQRVFQRCSVPLDDRAVQSHAATVVLVVGSVMFVHHSCGIKG